MWLRQMAQLSTTMSAKIAAKQGRGRVRSHEISIKKKAEWERWSWESVPQAQRETAFHFLISKRLPFLQPPPAQEEEAGTGATVTPPLSIASREAATLARITIGERRGEEAALSTVDGARFIMGCTLRRQETDGPKRGHRDFAQSDGRADRQSFRSSRKATLKPNATFRFEPDPTSSRVDFPPFSGRMSDCVTLTRDPDSVSEKDKDGNGSTSFSTIGLQVAAQKEEKRFASCNPATNIVSNQESLSSSN
jgi:hypothetical protein